MDDPHLSNPEIGRQVGVSERVIRYWKKHPAWEQERQKIISERAEAMGVNQKEQREELKRKLEEQERVLEKLYNGIYINIMQALRISNAALAELSKMDDPTKACRIATKSGTHIQSSMAIAGVGVMIRLIEQKFQINLLLDYFEKLDQTKTLDR